MNTPDIEPSLTRGVPYREPEPEPQEDAPTLDEVMEEVIWCAEIALKRIDPDDLAAVWLSRAIRAAKAARRCPEWPR